VVPPPLGWSRPLSGGPAPSRVVPPTARCFEVDLLLVFPDIRLGNPER
jgi:hypothetical protein